MRWVVGGGHTLFVIAAQKKERDLKLKCGVLTNEIFCLFMLLFISVR